MITNKELEQRLLGNEQTHYVKVQGDGYHYKIIIVSDAFQGKSKVARQQWIYAQLNDDIVSGALHALSMQAYTKEEWERQHG